MSVAAERRARARGLALAALACTLLASAVPAARGRDRAADGEAEKQAEAPDGKPPLHVEVPGDRAIEVVMGPADSDAVIAYLHGVCGDPLAFSSWAAAAAKHATLISLRGDVSCKDRPGRSKWSWNHALNDQRIRRAAALVSKQRVALGMKALSDQQVALIGYSQGAKRVESLAYQFPKRYRRVAVIASAREPELPMLLRSERVLFVAGAWDARQHIYEAERKLAARGHQARYLELPKARHGEYGPQALEVMGQGLDWLFKPDASD